MANFPIQTGGGAFDPARVANSGLNQMGSLPANLRGLSFPRANAGMVRQIVGRADQSAMSAPETRNAYRRARESGGKVSQYNALLARVRQLEDQIAQGGPVQGGPVFYPSREFGVAPYVQQPTVGVGGILTSDPVEFAAGAAAGTTLTATFGASALSRLSGTIMELVSVLPDDEIAAEARKIEVTASVNNQPIPTLDRVPLDLLIPSLMGESSVIPANVFVKPDAQVEFTYRVVEDLGTATAQKLTARAFSGNGATFIGSGGATPF